MTLGTFGGRLFKNFEVSENRLFGDDLGDDFGNFRWSTFQKLWDQPSTLKSKRWRSVLDVNFSILLFSKSEIRMRGRTWIHFHKKNTMRRSTFVFNNIVRTSSLSFWSRKLISNSKKRWSPKVYKIISGVVSERPNFRDLELLKKSILKSSENHLRVISEWRNFRDLEILKRSIPESSENHIRDHLRKTRFPRSPLF